MIRGGMESEAHEKHLKYKTAYKPNDFYWGLGIEHETYLETSKLKQVTLKELKENRARERYCVDYYSIYDKDTLNLALDGLFEPDKEILIPILVNSHTFQKTDIFGEHMTTYERVPKPNPKFNGKTIFQWMREENPDIFVADHEKSFTFDGDTVEFMTQNFYKANVTSVIEELGQIEKDFMRALNSLPREGLFKLYAPFQIAQKNYPFASYLTNLKNNAMFNNGTIHINITLPTKLDAAAKIADMETFKAKHQNLARILQWVSPLLVARYGAYDPLCESKTNGDKFAAGSQRVEVSRYIGMGTYDTDKMEPGKILTCPKSELSNLTWYDEFHKNAGVKYLNDLGMDINYNKHYAHGIEFRILDALPISDLEDILRFIVYLADFSLEYKIENPLKSALWHRVALKCVHDGKGYYMDVPDQNELFKVFKINHISKEPLTAVEMLDIIKSKLKAKYKDAQCARLMINDDHTPIEENTVITKSPPIAPIPNTTDATLFVVTLPPIKEEPTVSRESSTSQDSIESTESVDILPLKPLPLPAGPPPVEPSAPPPSPAPEEARPPVVSVTPKQVTEVPKKKSIWCC
jgi:hypothetical protein